MSKPRAKNRRGCFNATYKLPVTKRNLGGFLLNRRETIMKTNHKITTIFFIITIFSIGGCAFNQIERGLTTLHGENIKTAYQYLGYPDNQQKISGENVYTWGTNFVTNSTTPVFTSLGAFHVPTTHHNQCSIKIITNKKDIITNSQYFGNLAGCQRYGTALQKLYQENNMEVNGPESANSPLISCKTKDVTWKTSASACKEDNGKIVK